MEVIPSDKTVTIRWDNSAESTVDRFSRVQDFQGYRIYRSLHEAGYRVYGVNPNTRVVDGETIYPSLAALPERPEVVDLVVPPPVSEQVVAECARLGLLRVWLQPGAESEAVLRLLR